MKKIIFTFLLLIILTVNVQAAENTDIPDEENMEGYTEEQLEEETRSLIQQMDLSDIESVVDDLLGEESFSFSGFIQKLVSGE